jgi:hypothetical protein
MPGRRGSVAASVFINCPFDNQYWPIFEAVVFTVVACGFPPRCALEELDSGTVRLTKIQRIIRGCRFGIHDLSRVELAAANSLPRFNMPFELGLDIAAKAFGVGAVRRKQFLILDSAPYRYQQFISDISGQDIGCHDGSPDRAIDIVRELAAKCFCETPPETCGHQATVRTVRSMVAGELRNERVRSDRSAFR